MDSLDADGFMMAPAVFSTAEVERAIHDCEAALAALAAKDSLLIRDGGLPHGARNLLRLWPGAVALARQVASRTTLGSQAFAVRGLFFDKPPGDSWALPRHRDTTIAVKQHGPFGSFVKPTIKAGVPHVEAPREMLAPMLTVRIHLDDMTEANGPLRVIPGSHGIDATKREPRTLHCRAGDVLLMRPLLLHASGHCEPSYRGHRRIVHLELAPQSWLPDGYEWHDCFSLFEV